MSKVGQKLLERVRSAVEDGLTLRVVTVVGDITTDVQDDPKGKPVVKVSGDDQPSITTVFDLVDGDVRTFVHRRFVEQEPMKPMLQFHEEREKLAHARVGENIKLLRELYTFVKTELEAEKPDPETPATASTASTRSGSSERGC